MIKKPAFISSLGRHSMSSLAKDLSFSLYQEIHDEIKREGFNTSHFKKLSSKLKNGDILANYGLKVGTALLLKTIEGNDLSSVHRGKLSFAQTNQNRFARSRVFNQVTVHYGKETSQRIVKYKNNPNIEVQKKVIFDTESGLTPKLRKNLNLTNGFNEANYAFLPSDFGLTRKKFKQMHKNSLNLIKRRKNDLE